MKVNRIELPNELTVATAKQFIGRIASVCTGVEIRDDKHAESIGEKNLTEDRGRPTRAWEFLPYHVYTNYNNFRGYLNDTEYSGGGLFWIVNEYNTGRTSIVGRKDYHIINVTVPRYVAAHIKTHTTLSTLMSSIRIGCNGEKEYEFPEVEYESVMQTNNAYGVAEELHMLQCNIGKFIYRHYTHSEFNTMLRSYYKRPEIHKRPLSDFELVDMNIGGYMDAWQNFIDVRTGKGVQKETKELATMIKELIHG